MPRPCSACADPRRPELDAALAAGEAFRAKARRFAPLSRDAIRRHRPHVGAAIVRAAGRKTARREASLEEKVWALERTVHRLREKSEAQDDYRAALVACDRALDIIRLQREDRPRTNITPETAARMSEEELTAALLKAGFIREMLDVPDVIREASPPPPAVAPVAAPSPSSPPSSPAPPPPAPEPAVLALIRDRAMPQPVARPSLQDGMRMLGDSFAERLKGLV